MKITLTLEQLKKMAQGQLTLAEAAKRHDAERLAQILTLSRDRGESKKMIHDWIAGSADPEADFIELFKHAQYHAPQAATFGVQALIHFGGRLPTHIILDVIKAMMRDIDRASATTWHSNWGVVANIISVAEEPSEAFDIFMNFGKESTQRKLFRADALARLISIGENYLIWDVSLMTRVLQALLALEGVSWKHFLQMSRLDKVKDFLDSAAKNPAIKSLVKDFRAKWESQQKSFWTV